MNHPLKTLSFGLLIGLMGLQSCIKDPKPEIVPSNEGELITTCILKTTDSADGQTVYTIYRDLDGEGGNGPSTFDSITLQVGHTYATEILLLDESKTAVDTISQEVSAEGADHLFVFTPQMISLNIEAKDLDKNGLPIGLQSIWRTNGTGRGKVRITLKHQPGIKNGDPLIGETDLDIEFNCKIN